jgi:hypothetical protein
MRCAGRESELWRKHFERLLEPQLKGTVGLKKALTILLALLAGGAYGLRAQENVPILSGGLAFIGSNTAGAPTYQPIVVPVLVAPFGDHWLVESRGEIQGFFYKQDGTSGPYNGIFAASLDYLQVDYIANKHLTITAGRFLTPFNIYNERLSPIWFVNLVDSPIIYTIGTRTSASSNGGMIRGVAIDRESWTVSYTAYFSALTTTENLQSGRSAGGRASLFLPHVGVEIGASYQRFLQSGDYNASGMYFVWQPRQIPLDVRSEYAHSPGGHGYWLEGAYHLASSRDSSTWLSRLQPVARVQQYFKGNPTPEDILPNANVNQFDVGLNYWFPHDVRINGSYGRMYSSQGNGNIWNFELSYRFLFPAWPGGAK